MSDPWVAVEATIRRSAKMAALPNDTARYGFIVALGECKLLARQGSMTPEQWPELMGRFARYLKDYVSVGLVHLMPAWCGDRACMRGRGPFPDGRLVIHNWPTYQREHARRQAEYEQRLTDGPDDARTDVVTDVTTDTPSRGGTGAVAVPVVVDVSTGEIREPYQVGDDRPDESDVLLAWLMRTHRVVVRPGGGWHVRVMNWFSQGATMERAKAALDDAVADGNRLDGQVIPAAEDILFPRRQARPESPKERRDRDIADAAARIRAEAAAARAQA